ncbi:hypothetical protein [Metabacillus sp. 84]|uniref:hypothetical protein n=1 Tax=unclassified Metabacillus TaxID=2675274 RepID=UPI003CFB8962
MSRKWLIILTMILAAAGLGWYVLSSFQAGTAVLKKEHDAAMAAAVDNKFLATAEKATLFNGPNTDSKNKPVPFYAVHGKDESGRPAAALMSAGDLNQEPVTVVLADGITEEKAAEISGKEHSPKKMFSVKLGVLLRAGRQVPVWEVKYIDSYDRYTYDYIDFKSGNILTHIAIK